MSPAVHSALIALSLAFLVVGGYHRIRAAQTRERLDRRKEGWGIMIGLRLVGLIAMGSTALWLWRPEWFDWAAFPIPEAVRWLGVGGYGFAVFWLSWMFVTLGRNLTDTVVTRREAYFVDYGPYRFVRNPMYLGILIAGVSLGFAFGTWLTPLAGTVMFAILARRTAIEETYLIARFGEDYRAYMARVGRFFPRLP